MKIRNDRGPCLRPKRGAVLAIAVLTLFSSGCSDSDDLPSALESRSADGRTDQPAADPIEFGAKPLWDKSSQGDYAASRRDFADSRVIGDRVVHSRLGEGAQSHLTVADAKTGKPKWKLAEDDPIAGSDGLSADFLRIHPLGESAKAKALIIEYLKPATLDDGSSGEESGVAAVSMKTGELLWHAPVVTAPKYDHNLFVDASTSEYVAVSVSELGDDSELDDLAVVGTKEHKVLWRKPDLRASGIVGDTVLARKPLEDDKSTDRLALKAADGDKRWKLDKNDDPEILETTSDSVIASVSGTVTVIDPESGDTRAKPKVSATDCHYDGESTLACQAQDDDDNPKSAISTIVLSGDSAKARQVPKSDTYTLTGMYKGRIFAEKWTKDGMNYRALGPAGDTVADKLPGRLIDTSDHYAVFTFRNTDGSATMTVHEVSV